MRHLKKFNESLEPELIRAIDYLKSKPKEPKEDLNIPRMEYDTIFKAISKYWMLTYREIAEILGMSSRTFNRKIKEYDLEDLKQQMKIRRGKGWKHPYNTVSPEEDKIEESKNPTRVKNYEYSSKNKNFIDVILDDPSHFSSPSHSILLKKHLLDTEDWEILRSLKDVKKMTPSQRSKYFRDKLDRDLAIPLSNLQFLKDRQKEIGDINCEYCKKGPLKIYDFNPEDLKWHKVRDKRVFHRLMNNFDPKDGATCDHKNPISKGGDPFDYENLAVACQDCNQRKGNMTWEDWMKKMNLSENFQQVGPENITSGRGGSVPLDFDKDRIETIGNISDQKKLNSIIVDRINNSKITDSDETHVDTEDCFLRLIKHVKPKITIDVYPLKDYYFYVRKSTFNNWKTWNGYDMEWFKCDDVESVVDFLEYQKII